ncbi:uncharacterized protein BDV17DRAFT_288390 [Aspergillus undulatus]|uniref:uncharacterized protein n=1 Tax=Aspergillus undulatus TaxID=1810928 RepID=UPI003CCD0F12
MAQSQRSHQSRADDQDTEMPDADADSPRVVLDKRPELPPRAHSHAQAAAMAATAVTEKFVNTFWRITSNPETKPLYSSSAPPPLPHQPLTQSENVSMPEPVHTGVHELHPATQPSAEAASAPPKDAIIPSSCREEELLLKVKQLETDLQAESAQKKCALDELRQRTSELDSMRKRWKQAARELDKAQAQHQGFYQVTDNYLIDLTTRLRYNIRNFAIQYFGGELSGKKTPQSERSKEWEKYMVTTTPEPSDVEVFLLSERRPAVIQGFLWRFLVDQVLDHFRWAGETGVTLRNLCLFLRPEDGQYSDSSEKIVPEEERKFQIWLATTTAMILEAGNDPHVSETFKSQNKAKVASLVEKIRGIIDPFTTLQDQSYQQELARILQECIELDKEICRQVARVEWDFPPPAKEIPFDPKTMKRGTGETSPRDKKGNPQLIRLVICPAMKKRGKSNGEDFGAPAALLIPMEVSCQPVD